jgi:hypothetical protein
MSEPVMNKPKEDSRVLILSQRHYSNFVFNSCLYEFEDIINQVDRVDLLTIEPENLVSTYTQKCIKHSSKVIPSCINLTPLGLQSYSLAKNYDIFFVILDFPWNFYWINLLKQWRQKSTIAVCYLIEMWQPDLNKLKNYLKYFENFDYVFLGHSQIVDFVSKTINRPCQYLPPAIDTLKFKPNSIDSHRCIDLCNMGRRSTVTHQALLNLAEKEKFFYHYDSTGNSNLRLLGSHQNHRTLNANILKNSRYFITNHAKVNLPQQIAKQTEIGYRFFEGAASGSVMLGCPPNSNAFRQYFDWQDSVIPIPFDEPNIAKVIADLDAQPERLEQIRCDNLVNSLLRHDWVYRWQEILAKIGVKPDQKTIDRQKHLEETAQSFAKSPVIN